MSKSKLIFSQISKLIEQGLYNYKDLSDEFISILKSPRVASQPEEPKTVGFNLMPRL